MHQLSWDRASNTLEPIASIDVFRLGEDVKGIAFVKNGKYLVVTTELDEILFFELGRYVPVDSPRFAKNERVL